MYTEDEFVPISALAQLAYCPRRCALLHLEGAWEDNRFTIEGRLLHENVHEHRTEAQGPVRIARGLRLHSLRLGLVGQADVVEFHRLEADPGDNSPDDVHQSEGACLPGQTGRWRPFPVEHKRGRPKPQQADEVQLCAQAICLEEMLQVTVPRGALFYHQPRRRTDVTFDGNLRQRTEQLAQQLHELLAGTTTPSPDPGRKCSGCSLRGVCLPEVSTIKSVADYVDSMLAEPIGEEET